MQKLTLAIAVGMLISTGGYAKEGSEAGGAVVKGSLSKDIIRDVIVKHIGEVKNCYEPELDKNKDLAGKVMTHFIIGTEGKVTESKIEQTTLRNEKVEKCIAEAIRAWQFPKPQGGVVTVTYPFVLAATGEEAGKAAAKK
jgi:TonB family protein